VHFIYIFAVMAMLLRSRRIVPFMFNASTTRSGRIYRQEAGWLNLFGDDDELSSDDEDLRSLPSTVQDIFMDLDDDDASTGFEVNQDDPEPGPEPDTDSETVSTDDVWLNTNHVSARMLWASRMESNFLRAQKFSSQNPTYYVEKLARMATTYFDRKEQIARTLGMGVCDYVLYREDEVTATNSSYFPRYRAEEDDMHRYQLSVAYKQIDQIYDFVSEIETTQVVTDDNIHKIHKLIDHLVALFVQCSFDVQYVASLEFNGYTPSTRYLNDVPEVFDSLSVPVTTVVNILDNESDNESDTSETVVYLGVTYGQNSKKQTTMDAYYKKEKQN
jgi:hypothetical protein